MSRAAWAYNLLGATASALALFSGAQYLFDFGLSETMARVISEYRDFTAPLHDAIAIAIRWLRVPFAIPSWYPDALIVSMVGTIAASRVVILDRERLAPGQPLYLFVPAYALWAIFLTVILYGWVVLLFTLPRLAIHLIVPDPAESPVHIHAGREIAFQCLFGMLGALAFFILNSFPI